MMDRKDCMSCGAPLGKGATKCRCGWTLTVETSRTFHRCQVVGCGGEATVRIDMDSLCYTHYIQHHTEQSIRENKERGIFTANDARADLRKYAKADLSQPRISPREHWHIVLSRPDAPLIAKEAAREALKKFTESEEA